MVETFGNIIKSAREEKNLLLRQVSSIVGIDQAVICKFEKGERKPTREQVQKLAEFYDIDKNELLVACLSDKIVKDLQNDKIACEILKIAEVKIKTIQKSKEEEMDKKHIVEYKSESEIKKKACFENLFCAGTKALNDWKPLKKDIKGTIDVLDFFSGCGGMSLGFAVAKSQRKNRYKIIGGVDINEIALKSFERNFKAKTLCCDIRDIYLNNRQQEISDFFGIQTPRQTPLIIIGCAPCQGFSAHQNKNKKKIDDRNTLIGAFAEIVVAFKPDYIVMENVPEILSKKYMQHYQEAKKTFEKHGYSISQKIYNAASFGVPQARYRAIIVASKSDFELPSEILLPNQYVTVKSAIGNLPEVKPGEIVECDYYHRCASHKKSTIDTISQVPKDGGSRPKGIGPKCLDKVNGFSDVYGRLSWDKPAITITQYSRNPASGRFTHPVQNRGLTIREAARIQSFPDGFELEGNLDECFKQIGEAVPPLLSLSIATQIAMEIESKNLENSFQI